jgi:hypothetical protein
MSTNYYDAACFIPKRKVVFSGFGIFQNYYGNLMKMKVKWVIGEEHSEEFDIELNHEERDQENYWHTFELKSVGQKPIVVDEGCSIHCCIKVMESNDMKKCIYGYNGYKDRYSKFETQDYDFDMDYSTHNDGSTSDNWGQIPFILYS